jgi:hypothetical protein
VHEIYINLILLSHDFAHHGKSLNININHQSTSNQHQGQCHDRRPPTSDSQHHHDNNYNNYNYNNDYNNDYDYDDGHHHHTHHIAIIGAMPISLRHVIGTTRHGFDILEIRGGWEWATSTKMGPKDT